MQMAFGKNGEVIPNECRGSCAQTFPVELEAVSDLSQDWPGIMACTWLGRSCFSVVALAGNRLPVRCLLYVKDTGFVKTFS